MDSAGGSWLHSGVSAILRRKSGSALPLAVIFSMSALNRYFSLSSTEFKNAVLSFSDKGSLSLTGVPVYLAIW